MTKSQQQQQHCSGTTTTFDCWVFSSSPRHGVVCGSGEMKTENGTNRTTRAAAAAARRKERKKDKEMCCKKVQVCSEKEKKEEGRNAAEQCLMEIVCTLNLQINFDEEILLIGHATRR